MERLGRVGFDERVVDLSIFGKIGAISIDGLLKITDHAEVPRPGKIGFGLEPIADDFRRASKFKQKRKLARIGVLRLIQNDTKRFFPNFTPDLWMFRQLKRERDLVVVS